MMFDRIFAFLMAATLALFHSVAMAQTPTLPGFPAGVFQSRGAIDATSGGGAYNGPIDINGSAVFYAGFRAGSAAIAAATGNIADIVDTATGASSCTIKAATSGVADVTSPLCVGGTVSITTFCTVTHPAGCSVTKMYDQSGNGVDLLQTTLANMPILNLTGVAGAKPTLTCNGSTQQLTSTANITASSTFTMVDLSSRTSGTAFSTSMGGSGNTGLWFDGTNQIAYFAGSVVDLSASAPNGTFHRFQVFFNGASSTSFLNNAAGTSGNPGSSGITGNTFNFCKPFNFLGSVSEGGVWNGDKSANYSAMDANIKAFWGL